ncbi:hypothetical protein K438DRAFT_19621 [Mycena galopus ATCC 62051]|nr:hypothetical protein K438DRAFT_19621 [Mycena galopus ATCC 62051]
MLQMCMVSHPGCAGTMAQKIYMSLPGWKNHCGTRRGSYIWERSVHNVRIEQLWVNVTAQVGATWDNHFTRLEVWYGLDINNVAHIWLLHLLFLGTINTQLPFFAESWNQHCILMELRPIRVRDHGHHLRTYCFYSRSASARILITSYF